MKANIRNLFSVSMTDGEYFNDAQEKFELVSCPLQGKFCKNVRSAISKDYLESQKYLRNKEYQRSIYLLKDAYQKTFELTEPSCANCAEFFRSSINQSLENIQQEQQSLSLGLFSLKRFRLNFLKLDSALR